MSGEAKAKAGNPIWPRTHPPFVRAMLAGHSALGLAFAALIYLVCFSGSIAVLAPDLPKWERPAPQARYTGTVRGADISAALAKVQKAAPWSDDAFIYLPSKDTPQSLSIVVTAKPTDKTHEPTTWLVDNAGNLTESKINTPFSGFVAGMHTSLHLEGGIGGFIVGAAGVALLSSLISGLFSHPRVFKDAFNLRLGGNKRLQEVDIHNRLGVWALPFHVLISLSGALLGLTVLIVGILALAVFKGDTEKAYALFSGPQPVANESIATAPINFPAILADVKARSPLGSIDYIQVEHVTTEGSGINVNVRTATHASRGESYVYDRGGKYFGVWGNETGTIGQRIYMVLGPLHFGIFGGWPVKIAYVLLGLSLTSVTSSGVAIWLARRRDKGRPAIRFERLWAAAVWSQPLAYAVSGIYALLAQPADDDQIIPIWGAVTILSFLMTLVLQPQPLSRSLRTASAVGLLALAGVHVWAVILPAARANDVDPLMWAIDTILVVTAALLLYGLRSRLVGGKRASEPSAAASEGKQ